MRKLVLALISTVCVIAPAFAKANSDGTTPVIIFRAHAQRTNELVYTRGENIDGKVDDAFDFVPVDNDTCIWNYTNNYPEDGYTYSPPPAPVLPNLTGFIIALRSDPDFTATQRMAMASMIGLIQMDLFNPPALQEDWTNAVEAFGGSWLTQEAQKKITEYATTNHIPLLKGE